MVDLFERLQDLVLFALGAVSKLHYLRTHLGMITAVIRLRICFGRHELVVLAVNVSEVTRRKICSREVIVLAHCRKVSTLGQTPCQKLTSPEHLGTARSC